MPRWSERQIFGAALAAWLTVAVLALIANPPLGHDEAAYAISARGEAPAWNYRSAGTIAIARVGLALGGSDVALRVVPLILGAGLIVAAFARGRAAFDARSGAWAAAVLAGAHPMAARSAELIGDLAATAALLGGMAILIGELERERPRWRLVGAAPLFAVAFYVRYGSAPVVAMIALLALILYPKHRVQVLVTAAAFAALLVPHALQSIAATGSPLGILTVSAGMPRSAYIGEGLVTYLTSNPFVFYGAIVAPVMLAAFAGLFVVRPVQRARLFVIALALGQLISLGIESHAQPRYVFFATALLVIAGVDAIRRYVTRGAWLAPVACALAWLGLAIAIVPFQHYIARVRAPLYSAAETVRVDAHGRRCAIAANVVPQLMWATGCAVIVARSAPKLESPWPAVEVKYMVSAPHVVLANGLFDEVAATAHATPHELVVANPAARVWRLDR